MLINFCDGRALPNVSCDKVFTDSNPVENLISLQYNERLKGFIGENFVRPPVNVTIQFPCNIEVYRITINPIVGAQKSCGYEIFSCSDKVDTSPLLQNRKADKCCKSSFFVPIGKILLTELGSFCFTNPNFRGERESIDNVSPINQYKYNKTLCHGRPSALNFVSHITVRITRTVGGSAVCIKTLEVWGRPSKSSPSYIESKLKELFRSNAKPSELVDTFISKLGENDKNTYTNDIILKNSVEIPEDFVDCITQEIMTVPVLLPCGKNIDQSTLDKHVSTEGSWGRMPNDPFTGLVFDRLRKPVPNIALKGRIDQFVLSHSELLKHTPRTTGRRQGGNLHASKLVSVNYDASMQLEHPKYKIPITKRLQSLNALDLPSRRPNCKTGLTSLEDTVTSKNDLKVQACKKMSLRSSEIIDMTQDDDMLLHKKRKTEYAELTNTSEPQSVSSKSSIKGHENSLASSLNNALASALGSLPSFTKPQKSDSSPANCVFCNSGVVYYRLLCLHCICRHCLTSFGTMIECRVCTVKTPRNDVVRVHLC